MADASGSGDFDCLADVVAKITRRDQAERQLPGMQSDGDRPTALRQEAQGFHLRIVGGQRNGMVFGCDKVQPDKARFLFDEEEGEHHGDELDGTHGASARRGS